MAQSRVFDSTIFTSPSKTPTAFLFYGDVKSKKVCFALRTWLWLLRNRCAFLNCVFRLSPSVRIGTQTSIFIFFCPRTFLPTIWAYAGVELQPLTIASQKLHVTYLALPTLQAQNKWLMWLKWSGFFFIANKWIDQWIGTDLWLRGESRLKRIISRHQSKRKKTILLLINLSTGERESLSQ